MAAVVGILRCSFHLFDLFHLHFNFLLCLWLFWLLFLLALLPLYHLNFCVCCYFWLALVVDGSDIYHFAADWPRTHQSHSIFRVPLLQVLDLVGHLGVQFTETHYYPVFAPQGLVLKGQVRLHHISQPSQGRHLDDLVRLSQVNLFGLSCPLGLFGSSWLSKLKQSPDYSNVTFFELMLQVVGELDSRIHVTPAQPRLLPSQIDVAQTRRPHPLHLPLPSTKFLERGRPLLPRGLFVAVDVDEGEERDGEAGDDEEESDECVENFVERAHIF